MATLQELFQEGSFDMEPIEDLLNGMTAEARLDACRAIGRKAQAKLFEAAAGHGERTLQDMVPADHGARRELVHHGKNSLPAFRLFAKVFCRPTAKEEESELWGYNRGSKFVETFVGPGYFVLQEHEVPGELLVNYLRVPAERPVLNWPAILPNRARFSRFVYYDTQDVLRRVSKHVSIGRALKGGKPMDAWFVLCRDDVS